MSEPVAKMTKEIMQEYSAMQGSLQSQIQHLVRANRDRDAEIEQLRDSIKFLEFNLKELAKQANCIAGDLRFNPEGDNLYLIESLENNLKKLENRLASNDRTSMPCHLPDKEGWWMDTNGRVFEFNKTRIFVDSQWAKPFYFIGKHPVLMAQAPVGVLLTNSKLNKITRAIPIGGKHGEWLAVEENDSISETRLLASDGWSVL